MAHAAERLPVTIDGRSYLIETEGYSRTTVQTLREQRDTSERGGRAAPEHPVLGAVAD